MPVVDLFVPPDVHLAHALVLPVAPAAVFLGPRRATLTAALAVVARGAAGAERMTLTTENVTEARDGRGAFSPLLERAAAWTDHRPGSLVRALTAGLRAPAPAGLDDDMAVVALQRDEPRDCDTQEDLAVSR